MGSVFGGGPSRSGPAMQARSDQMLQAQQPYNQQAAYYPPQQPPQQSGMAPPQYQGAQNLQQRNMDWAHQISQGFGSSSLMGRGGGVSKDGGGGGRPPPLRLPPPAAAAPAPAPAPDWGFGVQGGSASDMGGG